MRLVIWLIKGLGVAYRLRLLSEKRAGKIVEDLVRFVCRGLQISEVRKPQGDEV